MYLHNDAPIFSEFMDSFFKFAKIKFKDKKIKNKLFIHSQCTCGQKDCATVLLKSKKLWKEEFIGSYVYNTNKGMIIIHILEDGYLEFEALSYEKYPYKKEIDRLLKNQKNTNIKIPRKNNKSKKISNKGAKKLHEYFYNLKNKDMQVIDLGEIKNDDK